MAFHPDSGIFVDLNVFTVFIGRELISAVQVERQGLENTAGFFRDVDVGSAGAGGSGGKDQHQGSQKRNQSLHIAEKPSLLSKYGKKSRFCYYINEVFASQTKRDPSGRKDPFDS